MSVPFSFRLPTAKMTGKDKDTVTTKKVTVTTSDNVSSSSEESSSEEESNDRFNDPATDLPADYWQIQKLVKYLKAGGTSLNRSLATTENKRKRNYFRIRFVIITH